MEYPRVGLIGLGVMGHGIGKNLIKKGFPLAVYDVSKFAIARLCELGASACETPSQVAQESTVVVTVLPDGPQVEQVILGKDGVLAGAREGTLLVECSTIDPAITRRVGEQVYAANCAIVDAGMGGTSQAAEDGTLSLFVGGRADHQEQARPILEAFSTAIFACGELGSGVTMKLVNNLLAASILCANLEALLLGAKAGLDVETMCHVLTTAPGGGADNLLLRTAIPKAVLPRRYKPGFKTALAHKDVGIAQSLAAQLHVPLFTLAPARQLLSAAIAQGKGDDHIAVLATVLEDLSGQLLSPPLDLGL